MNSPQEAIALICEMAIGKLGLTCALRARHRLFLFEQTGMLDVRGTIAHQYVRVRGDGRQGGDVPVVRPFPFLTVALMLLAVMAQAAPGVPTIHAQEGPRLASISISIWPEYDRPEAALVIIHGKLADGVSLPATVALRIPASTGGPTAVASAASENAPLTTRNHGLTNAENFLLVTLTTPDPVFQVEFYDPLATDNPDRTYAYIWPGDLAANQLGVEIQEPRGATGLSSEPDLGRGTVGPDGLAYHNAQLGPSEVGKTLTINVRYRKTDPRTSLEILGLEVAESSSGGIATWLLLLAALAAVVLAVVVVVYWHRQRAPAMAGAAPGTHSTGRRTSGPREASPSQAFCTQCGNQLGSDDHFCSRCGTKARGN